MRRPAAALLRQSAAELDSRRAATELDSILAADAEARAAARSHAAIITTRV